MPDTIPNLWSDHIRVNILTPVAILRTQAGLLTKMTQGLLEGKVETIYGADKLVQHQFDLIAPALAHYRQRLLTATHQDDRVYPVTVEAECFEAGGSLFSFILALPSGREAATEEEFIELVRKALRSSESMSVIQSLIARSNEQKLASSSSSATG